MSAALLLRASLRRNVATQSLRSFASRAPPPPKAPQGSKDKPPTTKDTSASSTSPEPQDEPLTSLHKTSTLPSLDFAPGEEAHQERTGAKSSKDSLSSIERKRRFMGRVSMAMVLVGAGVATWYSGREWEEDELKELRLVRVTRTLWLCPPNLSLHNSAAARSGGYAVGENATTFLWCLWCT